MVNQKTIIGGIAALLVIAIAIFVWKTLPNASKSPAEQVAAVPQQMATSTYATSTYYLVYPKDFSLSEAYVYDKVNPKKPIYGVKFTIPMTMATGTNLSGFDTGISVEQLPRAKKCTGDIYVAANVKPAKIIDGGVEYSVATSSEGAAGNIYEETVYALTGSSPCTAVRYFVHSTELGNYTAGTVHEFDRAGLTAAFDTIRQSMRLGAMPAPTPVAPSATP